jgi:hypothetical protein
MAEKACEYTADEWQKKYDEYLKQNMPEKKANSKADQKTRGETYQQFRKLRALPARSVSIAGRRHPQPRDRRHR